MTMPAGIGSPAYMGHVVGEIATETGGGENVVTDMGCLGSVDGSTEKRSVGTAMNLRCAEVRLAPRGNTETPDRRCRPGA